MGRQSIASREEGVGGSWGATNLSLGEVGGRQTRFRGENWVSGDLYASGVREERKRTRCRGVCPGKSRRQPTLRGSSRRRKSADDTLSQNIDAFLVNMESENLICYFLRPVVISQDSLATCLTYAFRVQSLKVCHTLELNIWTLKQDNGCILYRNAPTDF